MDVLTQRLRRAMIAPTLVLIASIIGAFFISDGNVSSSVQRIGYVQKVKGSPQIQTPPSSLWVPLQEGDPIYSTDRLKTSSTDEINALFTNQLGRLALEPETEIQFETNSEDKILIKISIGGMILETPKPRNFLVKDELIHTLTTEKSYVIKEDQRPLRLNPSQSLSKENPFGIEWLSENGDFRLMVDRSAPSSKSFQWKINKPDEKKLEVVIEWGLDRRHWSHQKRFPIEGQKAEIDFPTGEFFWRWGIMESKSLVKLWQSPAFRGEISRRFPPALLNPIEGQLLTLNELKSPLVFRWTPQSVYREYRIEIARDQEFNDILRSEITKAPTQLAMKIVNPGTYWWRVDGFDKGTQKWVQGKPSRFKVLKKPMAPFELRWLTTVDKKIYLPPESPRLALDWSVNQASAVSYYLLRISEIENDLQQAPPLKIFLPRESVPISKMGRYHAQIQAFDREDYLLGQSPVAQLDLETLPQLRAPAMTALPRKLTATSSGNLSLRWPTVDGASFYQLDLLNEQGQTASFKSKTNNYSFENLMPGRYSLAIYAFDQQGRQGLPSEPREIIVPLSSAVQPLKIKKLEVD